MDARDRRGDRARGRSLPVEPASLAGDRVLPRGRGARGRAARPAPHREALGRGHEGALPSVPQGAGQARGTHRRTAEAPGLYLGGTDMTTTLLPPKTVAPARAARDTQAQERTPKPIEHLAIIVSKGSLDMAYPGLILANAARMSGIEATLFFTFWGLDVITEDNVDHLHVATVGNPSMHIPTMLGGLPGMENIATSMMKKQIEELDIPPVREMLEILGDSGAKIYACRMAMDMFKRTKADLVPQVQDVISAMDFFDKPAGAQVIFI